MFKQLFYGKLLDILEEFILWFLSYTIAYFRILYYF